MAGEKGALIAWMKSVGYPTKHTAWIIYKDRSERGQRKVRAMCSYMKKRTLNEPRKGSVQDELSMMGDGNQSSALFELKKPGPPVKHGTMNANSLREIASNLRRKKNLSAAGLWTMGFNVRTIAVLLYGDDSEECQNRVWAHISKFKKQIAKFRASSGFDFHEQNLRSGVAVGNFPKETCDFGSQPQPKPELEHMMEMKGLEGSE